MEAIVYPVRINRYLALKGFSTRRGADTLIEERKVKINGREAKLGEMIHEKDIVTVENFRAKQYTYFAYYKPREVITHSPQGKERDIKFLVKNDELFPVGRLDKDSEGLIILTNDGRITDRLLNPEYEHEKEYEVEVDLPLKESFKNKMERGVLIEGYRTKECSVNILSERKFRIILTEGKKHQIRRMCVALGYQVKHLKRIRVMNVTLGTLKQNQKREISQEELETFLTSLGLVSKSRPLSKKIE